MLDVAEVIHILQTQENEKKAVHRRTKAFGKRAPDTGERDDAGLRRKPERRRKGGLINFLE